MDKYSRTEKQEINGALNYINYLTRKELQNFLISQLKEHQILNSPDNFRIYILNDIDFNYPDIDAYIKSKSKKELIQLIYGFEKYCFSTRNEDNSNCQISYQKSKVVFPPLPVSSNSRFSKAGIIGPGDRSYFIRMKKYKNKGCRKKY